jgi:hypothetical protein
MSGRAVNKARQIMSELLESRQLLSTYYVATWGSNQGQGTSSSPYQTIQQAANVANWGDTVAIYGGTYHETVTPAHSGVTFTSVDNTPVVIDGADAVSNWSNLTGSVYTTQISSLGDGNNQVFVDGQMVPEASWPAGTTNPLHPAQSTIGGYSNGIIYDSNITQGSGFWNGADIHITPGDGWVTYTGTVMNSGPGWLQVALPSLSSVESPIAGNHYYLTGVGNALQGPDQWYVSPSGTLYLWDSSSDNPAYHSVEVKQRALGFNLSNISNTTIENLNIFASTIQTDWGSPNTVINNITAQYISQLNQAWQSGWQTPSDDGIEMGGNGSIIENSTIAYSAGDGIHVGNNNITVTGNVIHDVDYVGSDAAGIRVSGTNVTVSNNVIYNTGRDGINDQAAGNYIENNTIHDFMLLTADGGGIYAVNIAGGTLSGNLIYNGHTGSPVGLDAVGIMLDNSCSWFTVDGNTTINVDDGFKANNNSYDDTIYNNQFGGTNSAIASNGWVGFAFDWSGTQLYNNTFYNSAVQLGNNVAAWGNNFAWGNPSYSGGSWASGATLPTPAPVVVSPPALSISNSDTGSSSSGSDSSSNSGSNSSSSSSGSSTTGSSDSSGSSDSATSSGGSGSSSTSTGSGSPSQTPASPPSSVPPALPTPPKTSTAASSASSTATSKPKVTSTSSTPASTALKLSGSLKGNYVGQPGKKKVAARAALGGRGTLASSPLGKVALTGRAIGVVSKGKATGTLVLSGKKGAIVLSLTAPAPTTPGATPPTTFTYTVTRGTGAFKHATAQGTVTLTYKLNKRNTAGTFTVTFS